MLGEQARTQAGQPDRPTADGRRRGYRELFDRQEVPETSFGRRRHRRRPLRDFIRT